MLLKEHFNFKKKKLFKEKAFFKHSFSEIP